MSAADPTESLIAVRHWLDRHKAGEESARAELLEIAMRRLRLLARHLMQDIAAVRQFEQTDDVLQNSLLRLWKCLEDTTPDEPVDFFRLAACLIRRELIDLSRHHFSSRRQFTAGTAAADSSAASTPMPARGNDDTFDPQQLSEWTEFHEYVERLPPDERSLFDLLWYQGLTMDETSALLDIPLRTLGRRWKQARIRLYRDLLSDGSGPDEPG